MTHLLRVASMQREGIAHDLMSPTALCESGAVDAEVVQLPGDVSRQLTQSGLPIVTTRPASEVGSRGMHIGAQFIELAAALHGNRQIKIAEAITKTGRSAKAGHYLPAL